LLYPQGIIDTKAIPPQADVLILYVYDECTLIIIFIANKNLAGKAIQYNTIQYNITKHIYMNSIKKCWDWSRVNLLINPMGILK
jgi:hypothetical protein